MAIKKRKKQENINIPVISPEDEERIRFKIKTVLEAKELDDEQSARLEEAEAEKVETLEKIRIVLDAEEEVIEEAAEKIAPDFDYDAAAEDLEAEEAAQEIKALYGIELLWSEAEHRQVEVPPALVSPSKYPRERYVARTKLGEFFFRDRHRLVMGIWLVVFVSLNGVLGIEYAIPDKVQVTYQTMQTTHKEIVETRARTIGDFRDELIAKGYGIGEQDAVIPAEEAEVRSGMSVEIMQATEKMAMVGGIKRTVFLIPGTVEENLEFNDIRYDSDDEISPALDTEVSEKTRIRVDEVHYKTKIKQEKVEAVSKVILDPTLTSGVEMTTKGNDGEGIFVYKYKYVNGKKDSTKKKVKKWIKEPHDNALRLGTSATGHSGEYIVVRTFIANCTAYSARPGAHGALGETVHRGTCAVDPSYVPYRSEMWIEGYGYAYANDCGGAVKGNVVDLFMANNSDCIQWGRRNKTAYILRPAR